MKLIANNWLNKIVYLFLATDISLIVLHLIHKSKELIPNSAFSVEQEEGYAKIFQYFKEYWIAILLCLLAVRKRFLLYLLWSLLFFYLLLDDSIQIHKQLGTFVSDKLAFSSEFNLRASDFGELAVSAGVGLFFLIFIATAYRVGDRASEANN